MKLKIFILILLTSIIFLFSSCNSSKTLDELKIEVMNVSNQNIDLTKVDPDISSIYELRYLGKFNDGWLFLFYDGYTIDQYLVDEKMELSNPEVITYYDIELKYYSNSELYYYKNGIIYRNFNNIFNEYYFDKDDLREIKTRIEKYEDYGYVIKDYPF